MATITSKMRFDVFKYKGQEAVMNNFPELNFIEWNAVSGDNMTFREMVRYLVLVYSADSPLLKDKSMKLQDRKERAAELAGWKSKYFTTNGWTKKAKEVFGLKEEKFRNIVVAFLRAQNQSTWQAISLLEQELNEIMGMRMKPVEDLGDVQKKDKLNDIYKSKMQELNELYKEFYSRDEEVQKELDHVLLFSVIENVVKGKPD
ncbi:MAG: hypothetical protein F6K19_01655 [Cyanothece sp. SIO1E1]|nr:hypothetical protein [Cyanothece sp. SIO1E1]